MSSGAECRVGGGFGRTGLRGRGGAGRAQPANCTEAAAPGFPVRALRDVAGPGNESLSGPSSGLLEVMS